MKSVPKAAVVEAAARAAHEAVRSWLLALGDSSSPPWGALPQEGKDVVMRDVESVFQGADSRCLHESWRKRQQEQGWKHGPAPDKAAKVSPALSAWDQLPDEYRRRVDLMRAVAVATGEALQTGKRLFGRDRHSRPWTGAQG